MRFRNLKAPPDRFPVCSGEAGEKTICNRMDHNEGNAGTNVEQGLIGLTCALFRNVGICSAYLWTLTYHSCITFDVQWFKMDWIYK